MNLSHQICLLFLLILFDQYYAQPLVRNFYFEKKVNGIGYVYGKAKGQIYDRVAELWISDLYLPMNEIKEFEVFVKSTRFKNLAPVNGSCTGDLPSIECSVFLKYTFVTDFNEGLFQVNVITKANTKFVSFWANYQGYKYGNVNNKCTATSDDQTCYCGVGIYEKETCKNAVPTPCYNLPISKISPNDLSSYTKPAIKIQFKEEFDENNIVKNTIYLYDDSTFKFYVLSYDNVPSNIVTKPASSDQFRLKLKISLAPTGKTPDKENYVVTNFDVQKIVQFENAFCEKLDAKTFVCVCCEYSETDSFCKTTHSNNEFQLFANRKINNAGYVWLRNAKAWVTNNKKQFQIRFFDSMKVFFKRDPTYRLQYQNDGESGSGRYSANVVCKTERRDYGCYFNFGTDEANKNGNVYFNICPFSTDDCTILIILRIEDYAIKITENDGIPCYITDYDGGETKQCICPSEVDASKVKTNDSPPKICVPDANTCPLSGRSAFGLKVDQNKIKKGGKFVFQHESQNDKRYSLEFEPLDSLKFKKHPKNGWPTKIWVAPLYISGSTDGEMAPNFAFSTGVSELSNAYCYDNGLRGINNGISCACCDDSFTGCTDIVEEYDFYFGQSVSDYGFIIGSGTVWSTTENFYAKINKLYVNNTNENMMKIESGQSYCYPDLDKVCSVKIEIQTVNLKYENSEKPLLVIFELDTDKKIKFDPTGCKFDDKQGTTGQFCVCMSGKKTDQNCPIQQNLIQQCNLGQTNNNKAPRLTFDSSEFEQPTELSKQTNKYFSLKSDPTKTYRLVYEPIREMATQHPPDDPIFLMQLFIGQFKRSGTTTELSKIDMNFEPNDKLWTFSQAYCQVNSNQLECVCCEGYTGSSDPICLNAQTTSEMKIKFSIVMQDYGFLLVKFELSLNSAGFFTFKGESDTLIKEFPQKFRLNFVRNGDSSDLQQCSWPECLFNFKDSLQSGDKIQMNIELLDNDGNSIANTEIDTYLIGSGNKITRNGNEDKCYFYENSEKFINSCSCPTNIDFDETCGGIAPMKCQKISQFDKLEINGKERKFASFYLKMGDPGENNPTFVFDQVKKEYYTFSYKMDKDEDPTKIGYKISIGPTKSSQQLGTSTILTNFNVSSNLIIFDNVLCSFSKNEWFCECCTRENCNYKDPKNDPIIKTTTTQKPNDNIATKEPVKPKEDKCKNRPKNEETTKLCDIDKFEKVDYSTMNNVTSETKQAINPKKATADDISIAGDIIKKLADVKNATTEQRKNTIELFDHILESREESFKENGRETSDNYLSSMDKILAESPGDITYLNGSNLGAEKKQLNCGDNQEWTGILDDSQKFRVENGGISPGDGVASIELNKEKLCENSNGKQSVYFVIYRNGKLFQSEDKGSEDGEIPNDVKESGNIKQPDRCKKGYDPTNGFILTSVVSNKNASINARLRFKKEDLKMPPHSNLAVTWWDKSEWSENKQCTFKLEGDEYVAHCSHLTNFALLVEKSTTDPLLCDTVLDKLGFWLSIISLVCLFILALIYLTRIIPIVKNSVFICILNNNRRKGADLLIIVYVLIMLMFYLFFAVFIDQSVTKSKVFCKLTAAFLYFLFLSAMFLNLFQAWDMIKLCAWNSRIENILQIATKIYIALPVSFGVPFLIVIIVFFTDGTFFFRDDQFCWIRSQSVIFAVLIPVTLMLLNSFVAFIIFCVRMFPDFFKRLGIKGSSVQLAKGEKQSRQMNLELFIVLLFAQFILGFPWILQYPAMFSSGSTVWHYLFAIFNGTNGLILFVIYFYGRAMAFYRIRKGNNSMTSTVNTTGVE